MKNQRKESTLRTLNDDKLQELCRRRNAGAEREIYRRYREKVILLAMGIVRNDEDALDVSQEVLTKLFQEINRQQLDNIGAWLSVTTRNQAISHFRKNKRITFVAVQEAFEEDVQTVAQMELTDHKTSHYRLAFWRELRTFNFTDQYIIIAYYYFDLGYPKISELLQIEYKQVRSRAYSTLRTIKNRLNKLL